MTSKAFSAVSCTCGHECTKFCLIAQQRGADEVTGPITGVLT